MAPVPLRALDSGRCVAPWEVSAPEECRSLSHQRNAGVMEGGQRPAALAIPDDVPGGIARGDDGGQACIAGSAEGEFSHPGPSRHCWRCAIIAAAMSPLPRSLPPPAPPRTLRTAAPRQAWPRHCSPQPGQVYFVRVLRFFLLFLPGPSSWPRSRQEMAKSSPARSRYAR